MVTSTKRWVWMFLTWITVLFRYISAHKEAHVACVFPVSCQSHVDLGWLQWRSKDWCCLWFRGNWFVSCCYPCLWVRKLREAKKYSGEGQDTVCFDRDFISMKNSRKVTSLYKGDRTKSISNVFSIRLWLPPIKSGEWNSKERYSGINDFSTALWILIFFRWLAFV